MNIATVLLPKGRVDGRGGLAVVDVEHVGVDRKRDARLSVAQAPADSDDVYAASNQ